MKVRAPFSPSRKRQPEGPDEGPSNSYPNAMRQSRYESHKSRIDCFFRKSEPHDKVNP
jgi:hypothetical protein